MIAKVAGIILMGSIIILVLTCVVTLFRFRRAEKEAGLFAPDPHNGNPYRRYCRKCDQQQLHFTAGEDVGIHFRAHGWWEPNGEIKDADCVCHAYTEYHG